MNTRITTGEKRGLILLAVILIAVFVFFVARDRSMVRCDDAVVDVEQAVSVKDTEDVTVMLTDTLIKSTNRKPTNTKSNSKSKSTIKQRHYESRNPLEQLVN